MLVTKASESHNFSHISVYIHNKNILKKIYFNNKIDRRRGWISGIGSKFSLHTLNYTSKKITLKPTVPG